MKMLCHFYKHIALPSHLTIDGAPFSSCARCSVHMIQWGLDWIPIHRGKRLVWEADGAALGVSSIQVMPISRAQRLGSRMFSFKAAARRGAGAGGRGVALARPGSRHV